MHSRGVGHPCTSRTLLKSRTSSNCAKSSKPHQIHQISRLDKSLRHPSQVCKVVVRARMECHGRLWHPSSSSSLMSIKNICSEIEKKKTPFLFFLIESKNGHFSRTYATRNMHLPKQKYKMTNTAMYNRDIVYNKCHLCNIYIRLWWLSTFRAFCYMYGVKTDNVLYCNTLN